MGHRHSFDEKHTVSATILRQNASVIAAWIQVNWKLRAKRRDADDKSNFNVAFRFGDDLECSACRRPAARAC